MAAVGNCLLDRVGVVCSNKKMVTFLPLMLFIIIGFPVGLILLIIGIVLGLWKKTWKLALFALLFLLAIFIVYIVAQGYYLHRAGPSVYKNLQKMTTPQPIRTESLSPTRSP